MDRSDKERVLVEVSQRVLEHWGQPPERLERAIFDTLFEERHRLESEPDDALRRAQELFYDRIYGEALHGDALGQKRLLRELIEAFAREVSGHFDPRVYAFATRVIPVGLSLLLNALSPIKLASALPRGLLELDEQLEITGQVSAVQKLAKLGTLILTPTHLSNLDSILMGFSIYRLGLPPHLYGAGLNLFRNQLIGFFMHNLGAYKVDRRKKAELYKDVLKTYAGCSMELGYHNLFFPGGTRSRSGAIEQHLKLGLLGMGLDAYIHNLLAQKSRPDIFVVPCTINYELVLEAESLIDDYLKESGKSRYIIEDDEFSSTARMLDFTKKLFSLESQIHIVLGQPLDVFGNRVDEQGVTRDYRGRPVDRRRYVLRDDKPCFDRQRDEEFTGELALAIVQSYQAHTMAKCTHVLCQSVFDWLRRRAPDLDLYRLLRVGGPDQSLPMAEAYEGVERSIGQLKRLQAQGKVLVDETLLSQDPQQVVSHALAHLASYHRRPALERRGDRLFHNDRKLIYYYQNRLRSYGLDQGEGLS